MKNQAKQLLIKLNPVLHILKRYAVFITFMAFALVYTVLIIRINQFAASAPADSQVQDKLGTIQHPRIDQPTLDKIQQLQAQNIQVKSLFDQARNNPFSE